MCVCASVCVCVCAFLRKVERETIFLACPTQEV